MKQAELAPAIKQICSEKGISEKDVLKSIEIALGAAYRKEYRSQEELVESEFNPQTGEAKFYRSWEVVPNDEEITNKERQIPLKKAKKKKKGIKVGDKIRQSLPQKEKFGRIAAQTAKQVILQQVREAERNHIYSIFKDKEGDIVNGVVQQIENGDVVIDLSQANGILFKSEQIPDEHYRVGQRLKLYIKEVEKSSRGSLIKLSRIHPKLISYLFKTEVPEIEAGTVEIKDIVREAGRRTKISVVSHQKNVDPVGSCVGQRGTRVQSVLAEIGNEKIDIIPYAKDPLTYIKNALSPAKISEIKLDKSAKKATVYVNEDQLSLAIGKQGQNVRLASKLTGYEIDIIEAGQEKKKEERKKKSPAKKKSAASKTETKNKTKTKKETKKRKKEVVKNDG